MLGHEYLTRKNLESKIKVLSKKAWPDIYKYINLTKTD